MADADGRDLSLIFMIDALGYEVVGRGGFLDRLIPPDRPRVRTVFGFSSAAIPSIMTGKLPREHGHWSMYRRDLGDSVFRPYRTLLRLASRLPRGQWRARRWLQDRMRADGVSGYFDLYEIPLAYLPLFDLCQRRNLYRPGAFPNRPGLFDHLARQHVSYRVWDWSADTGRAFQEMEAAARNGSERLLLLYTPGLDATMHTHGPRSDAARAWLRAHEEKIERVVAAASSAGRRPRVRVFGDHGMAAVRGEIDVASALRGLPHRMPRDYIVFLDSSMARFWFRDERARRSVTACLEALEGGRLVPPEELAALGVDFADHAYGEAIFLCDPGIVVNPSFMGHAPLAGMHGYHPDDPDSDTTLLADPSPPRPPGSILEIAPLILRDLGIEAEAT